MDDNPYRSPLEFEGPKRRKRIGGWPIVALLGLWSIVFGVFGGVALARAVSGGLKFAAGQGSWILSEGAAGVFAVLVSAAFFLVATRLAETLRKRN